MAENKKSFILYADLIHTVRKMPKEKAGELLMTILSYVNDESPTVDDLVVDLVFEPIKQQLKRDLKEWDVTKKDRSENGRIGNLKRWNKDLYEKVINEEITIKEAENIAKDRRAIKPIANVAVNDTVTVTVNDNDIKKDIKGGKPPAQKTFKNFSEKDFIEEIKKYEKDFSSQMLNNFFLYWKERSAAGKMKFQLEKTWETKLRLEKWKSNDLKFKNNGISKTPYTSPKSAGRNAIADSIAQKLGI